MKWWKLVLALLALLPVIRLFDSENGGVSSILIFTIFVAVLLWAGLQRWSSKLRVPLFPYFMILSIVFSGLTQWFVQLEGKETAFSANPYIHFVQALTIYICIMIVWYVALRRRNFSAMEVFCLTGIWGIVFENNFAVLLTFNPLFWLFIFPVYGSFATIPYLLTKERFGKRPAARWKHRILMLIGMTVAMYVSMAVMFAMALAGIS